MPSAGFDDRKRREAAESTLREMEALAARIRDLVASQPPHDLLGYIYSRRILGSLRGPEEGKGETAELIGLIDDTQFALEYIHASLATTAEQGNEEFDVAVCEEILACGKELKEKSLLYAMMTAAGTEDGAFGSATSDVEFRAKSTWILLRGNRYPVLEGEFYAFVLAPHNEILRETYGMDATEIAAGFQDMANAAWMGHADAVDEISRQMAAAHAFAASKGIPLRDAKGSWAAEHPDRVETSIAAVNDLLRGGICNVSHHTNLPADLLADLAFTRGEETEFFAEGLYCGTPLRTLPARKKPLIKLGNDYYAVDPCFTRDSGYRALLWNLLRRRPDYKKAFESRQKAMSEAAFFHILDAQLKGAKVNQEVWYKDPITRQWVENDTLIRIDDVLLLVEAKAGAAATIASPELDFPRHVQAVQDLVIKAYAQCKRFFDYLNSADEVPIFERKDGRYVECDRIRLADYRLLFPIGLTIESFSSFSTACKELPEIVPLLGKHPFLSLSIDDLFVLKRFLPTMGELAHYLEVRQAVAGMRGVHLFDEFDHLGAYIEQNRFDQNIEEQLASGNPSMILWDGMSAGVDGHFARRDWETCPVPTQTFPHELLGLLRALNQTRAPGWLKAESVIRSYGEEGRNNLAGMLERCRATLDDHPERYFQVLGTPSLFIWMQRASTVPSSQTYNAKASAAALAANTNEMVAILVLADVRGGYIAASHFTVEVPAQRTAENAAIFEDAERMRARQVPISASTGEKRAPTRLPGRNEPCWCGSRLKFKKCHGR